MAKLLGKNVGDVIVEWNGPTVMRNYNGAVPARVLIQVIGSGAVQFQTNTTMVMRAAGGSVPNPYTFEKAADPAGWVNSGAAVDQAAGLVAIPITEQNYDLFLRVIVSTAGTGKVIIQSDWS